MMNPGDMIWHWVGWTAAAATVLLLLCALLGDAVRQRFHRLRRCPKCWYDLSHTPGMRCSECGYAAKRERQLFKWRRRWRFVALAVALWTGVYLWNYARAIYDHGCLAGVPTSILVHCTPPPEQEHIRVDHPGGWQQIPHPVIAEMARRLDGGERFSSRQWRTLLTRARFVRSRHQWPIDVPLEFAIRPLRWGDTSIGPVSVSLMRDGRSFPHNLSTGGIQVTGWGMIESFGSDGPAPVASVRPGAYEIALIVRRWPSRGTVQHITTLYIPVTFVESVDDAIEPVRSAEVDALVREHLRAQVRPYSDSLTPVPYPWLNVNLSEIDDHRTRGMAVQVEVDVLRHGVPIAEGLVDEHSSRFGFTRMDNRIDLKCMTYEELVAAPQDFALRIRGSARRAVRIADATRYWAGEITIPCDQIRIEEGFGQFDH